MKIRKPVCALLAAILILQTGTASFAAEKTDTAECQHEHTTETEMIEPDCENYGYTAGVFCEDCKTYISGHQKISPIGHIDADNDGICDDCGKQFTIREAKDATCEEDGYTGDTKLDNGRILMGQNIPATGHTDTNKDYICDVCHKKIDKNSITLTLHYYVTKEDYETDKDKYDHVNVSVKENCNIDSCVYVTAKINTKQATETALPDYPVLARYEFQWIDSNNNIYSTFKFHKDTDLYMAYSEVGKDRPFGQAGDDVFWLYIPEEKIMFFYGNGMVWNDYKKRTELPWYEYLMKTDRTKLGGNVKADAWTIMPVRTS